MKIAKFLLLLLAFVSVLSANAQNRQSNASSVQHLTFLGIPINGRMDSFERNFKAKGYTRDQTFSSSETSTQHFYKKEGTKEDRFYYALFSPKTKTVFLVGYFQAWYGTNNNDKYEAIVKELSDKFSSSESNMILEYEDKTIIRVQSKSGNSIGSVTISKTLDTTKNGEKITRVDVQYKDTYNREIAIKEE